MDGTLVESHHSWTPIGQTSNQLILYHAPSHALQVLPRPSPSLVAPDRLPARAGPSRTRQSLLLGSSDPALSNRESLTAPLCPYCSQPLPSSSSTLRDPFVDATEEGEGEETSPRYFRILEQAHEGSRPPSPASSGRSSRRARSSSHIDGYVDDDDELDEKDLPARGYYDRYFREECKLGMGAEGSVFLATHVIGGTVLGTYAVKKIAVGRSKEYLFRMLREVRLLEALRHPNIIPYHHSWIEPTRFSSFAPPITALHVLMMYATAGNLDTYLLTRSHSSPPGTTDLTAGNIADAESLGQLSKPERIKAFKARRQSAVDGKSGKSRKREENRGVLLLGLEEIAKLFGDVVEGLAFLHANSILHLDLKCSNVLLHWEEGKLIPKAMISDFGTSEEMLRGKRQRTGHTGTMEYMAPETIVQDALGQWRPSDSHADMWSLGLILHKMLFLHLPYPDTDDYPDLMREILAYPGFIPTPEMYESFERRNIPRDLLVLLSKLAHVIPEERPSAEKVKVGLRGLEKTVRSARFGTTAGSIVRRFASPFGWNAGAGAVASAGPGADGVGESETDSKRWSTLPDSAQNRYHDYSPVRTVPLALPSPEDERQHPSFPPSSLVPNSQYGPDGRARLGRLKVRGAEKWVRSGVFVLKILSLQPPFNALHPPDSPPTSIVALLLLIAMGEYILLPHLPGSISAALAIAHFGVLVGYGYSKS